VAPNEDIDVHPANWDWVHCLTVPVETLNKLQLSERPYKWIRYAIGVVVGAEGDLCTTPESTSVVDYDAVLPTQSVTLYYRIGNKKRLRLFPVDPDIVPMRSHVSSSEATTQAELFWIEVAERDRERCVLTEEDSDVCDAVRLIARSKGDSVCHTHLSICFSVTIAPAIVYFDIHAASQSKQRWK
jgi:hypothetical protein